MIDSQKRFEETKPDLATTEDIANVKADIIKWMFHFWLCQMASMVAILKMLL